MIFVRKSRETISRNRRK